MPKIIFQPLMISNPQSLKRLGHFLTPDFKSGGTPSGLAFLKKIKFGGTPSGVLWRNLERESFLGIEKISLFEVFYVFNIVYLQYIICNISLAIYHLRCIICDVIFSLCLYLNPQRFLIAATSWVSTFFSSSSGRLHKKSMPVLSYRVLIFTT